MVRAVDAPAAIVYAANDQRPRGAREEELCAKASSTDWLYMAASGGALAGSLYLDTRLKYLSPEPGIRTIAPGLVGLSWGFVLGGGYLALPKCSPDWVAYPPPEGDVRASWPLAVGLGLFAAVTGPFIEQFVALPCVGCVPTEWSVSERRFRVFAASGGAFLGALLPYVLPPKTWSNAKELEKLRLQAAPQGAFVSFTSTF
jgi:hypothetical protein